MSELTNEQRIHRASLAKQIVENEAFIEAVNNLDKVYIKAWRNAKSVEAREDAHRRVMLLTELCQDLKSMLFDGEVTKKRISELEGQKGGLRKIWG